jgi:hypothetical protein
VRNDIWRCRKQLQTDLPDAEREMIEKRLLERRSTFEGLLASTFPLALKLSSCSEEAETWTSCELSRGCSFGRTMIADAAKQAVTREVAIKRRQRTKRENPAGDAKGKSQASPARSQVP